MKPVRDIFDIYRELEEQQVLISFKGIISEGLLSCLFQVIDSRLQTSCEEAGIRKKLNNILVEAIQNIYHHVDELKEQQSSDTYSKGDTIFMVVKGQDGIYYIQTGNYILTEKCASLKDSIEHINSLTTEQLRTYHVEKLNTSEFSDKGGAGLGFIDMARKSGNKLIYGFHPVTEKYSFFSLLITVG